MATYMIKAATISTIQAGTKSIIICRVIFNLGGQS